MRPSLLIYEIENRQRLTVLVSYNRWIPIQMGCANLLKGSNKYPLWKGLPSQISKQCDFLEIGLVVSIAVKHLNYKLFKVISKIKNKNCIVKNQWKHGQNNKISSRTSVLEGELKCSVDCKWNIFHSSNRGRELWRIMHLDCWVTASGYVNHAFFWTARDSALRVRSLLWILWLGPHD